MLVIDGAEEITLNLSPDTKVMLLGGSSVGERHIWWNFVSSDKANIEQAKEDWHAERFATVPGDTEERIPLPENWQAV